MGLKGTWPQMSGQLELPLGGRGEAPSHERSEEVPMAAHETGSSGRRPAWSTSAGHLTIHFLNRPVRTRMPGGVAFLLPTSIILSRQVPALRQVCQSLPASP